MAWQLHENWVGAPTPGGSADRRSRREPWPPRGPYLRGRLRCGPLILRVCEFEMSLILVPPLDLIESVRDGLETEGRLIYDLTSLFDMKGVLGNDLDP